MADGVDDQTDALVELDGDELERWVAELRSQDAARSRSRTAWLRRQAAEDGSFVGTLLEAHEARRTLVIDTMAGNHHRGRIRLVGRDVCVVRADRGGDVVVVLDAIRSLRVPETREPVVGERRPVGRVTLHEVLAALVEQRPRVAVTSRGSTEPLRGELVVVGTDVVGLRLEGRGGLAYLPLTSLAELSVAESG